jgi:hypothetical protein
MQHL